MLMQQVNGSDIENNRFFGESIAINGSTAVVGAPQGDLGDGCLAY